MTIDEINAKVIEIAKIGRGDPERAHADEDDIYEIVLRAIANGTCEDPRGFAAAVLKTKEHDFERWYA